MVEKREMNTNAGFEIPKNKKKNIQNVLQKSAPVMKMLVWDGVIAQWNARVGQYFHWSLLGEIFWKEST